MNKKILAIIVIIGLIGSTRAAAGDPMDCATTSTSILKCASDGAATEAATTFAAACRAGYYFTFATATTSTCTICPVNTFLAADADTQQAVTGSTKTCTACPTGATTAATGQDTVADCVCGTNAAGKATALNTSGTAVCTEVPTGSLKTGGSVYTTSDGTTFVLAKCDATAGYQATPASSACTACTATGCTTCATAVGTCDGCRAGFRDTATDATFTCVACAIANCATCDSSGTTPANSEKCLTAKDGFYVDANSAVQACPPNATKCMWDTSVTPAVVKVTAVAAGYYIKTAATNVATACPTGKSSAANSDAAQADGGATSCTITCATNCLNCNTAGAGKCDLCQDDHYVDSAATDAAQVCVAFTETTRPITCQTASANDATGCTSCATDTTFRVKDPAALATDTKWRCVCPDGYTDLSNVAAPATKTAVCQACGTGVKNCDAGKPIVCKNAAEQAAGENCYATTAAQGSITGFFYDSATSAFKACESTCEKCAGGDATQCVTCAQITVDTTQLTEQDVTSLTAAWTNGTYTATAPGTCYAKCPEGYQTDPAVRTACEMGSFGNILSAIVLISFIILMF